MFLPLISSSLPFIASLFFAAAAFSLKRTLFLYVFPSSSLTPLIPSVLLNLFPSHSASPPPPKPRGASIFPGQCASRLEWRPFVTFIYRLTDSTTARVCVCVLGVCEGEMIAGVWVAMRCVWTYCTLFLSASCTRYAKTGALVFALRPLQLQRQLDRSWTHKPSASSRRALMGGH